MRCCCWVCVEQWQWHTVETANSFHSATNPWVESASTFFECYNCLTRWCEACELIRLDNSLWLLCGKNPLEELIS